MRHVLQRLCYNLLLVNLIIAGSLADPRFTEVPVDTLVLEGHNTQLNCSAENLLPYVPISWYTRENSEDHEIIRGNIPFDKKYGVLGNHDEGEYNMYIENATMDFQHIYQCRIPNLTPPPTAVAQLIVLNKGPHCSADPGYTVVAGENTTFVCNMSLPASAPGDLVWYMDGREVSRETGMLGEWTTTFHQGENGTTMNCQLEHYTLPREEWSLVNCGDDIVMDVQYAPVVRIADESERQVVEGDSYRAECEVAESGNPLAITQVHWLGPNGDIYQSDSPTLSIDDIDRRENGEYTCVMSNTFYDGRHGTGTAKVQVDVQYVPRVTIRDDTNATVVVGQRYEATCLPDANPTADIAWDFASRDVDVEFDRLVIERAEKQHATVYTCQANNTLYTGEAAVDSDSVDLDVQYSPELYLQIIGEAASHGAVVEGQTVTVNCKVNSSNPQIDTLSWFQGNQSASAEGERLHFSDISRDESGHFNCKAENTFWDGTTGATEIDIQVDVQYWDGVYVQDVSNRTVIEGQTYRADCLASANPPAEVYWILPGDTTLQSSQLELVNVSRTNSQANQYTCFGTSEYWNGAKTNGFKSVRIDVQYKPEVRAVLSQGHARFEDNSMTVVSGQPVSLNCESVAANPDADIITWEHSVPASEVFSFTADVAHNGKDCVCYASNTFWDGTEGSDSVTVLVEVQYQPSVDISDTNGFVEVEGRPYSVLCSAVGNPTPEVYWEGVDDQSTGSQTLDFDSIAREDSGSYNCFAVNTYWDGSLGNNSNTFLLDVQYPPEVSVPATVARIEGENVRIPCDVTAANPTDVSVTWSSADGSYLGDVLLSLEDVERGMTGTYTCTAMNTYYDGSPGVGSNTTTLDVQYVPDITFPRDYVLCKEGDNITLVCDVIANPAAHAVTWTKGVEEVSPGAVHSIANVKYFHSGFYTCTAVNTFYDGTEGVRTKTISVGVEHLPYVLAWGPDQPILEDTQTFLACDIIRGSPRPYQIALMKVGESDVETIAMVTNTSGVTELTYDIDAAKRWMNGTYFCNITTRFHDGTEGYRTSDITPLIVQYPPEMVDVSKSGVEVKLGEKAVLTCVVDAYPLAEVVWTDDKGEVVESEETINGTVVSSQVVIDNVDNSKLGTYTCNFANDISNNTAHERKLGKIIIPWSLEWLMNTGILYAIIAGGLLLIIILILIIVCCCKHKSDEEKPVTVSDLAALKRPSGEIRSCEGTENLGMVRTAPDGTGSMRKDRDNNETTLTTFKPQTKADIDREERMRKLSDVV